MAYQLETELIHKYGRIHIEANGTLVNRFIFTNWANKETREKQIASLKNYKWTEERRKNHSAALKNSKNVKAARKIVAEKLRGTKRTEQQCKNISNSLIGKKRPALSEEHRKKISIALQGKPKSAEHNKKVSTALTGRKNLNMPKRTIFTIKLPTDEIITITGNLEKFCESYNVNRKSLYNSLKSGIPISSGKSKNYQLIKLERITKD